MDRSEGRGVKKGQKCISTFVKHLDALVSFEGIKRKIELHKNKSCRETGKKRLFGKSVAPVCQSAGWLLNDPV